MEFCNASDAGNASDLLTVIVTTSPVRSNPSTEMLASTLESLALVPYLRTAPRLLVCDGCIVDQQKPQHKAGRVTAEEQMQYAEFVRCVKIGASSSESGPFSGLTILEIPTREGFGFAVRRALAEVSTPYVMVVQHDQHLARTFDLLGVLRAMRAHPDVIKYVGLCSESTQHYATTMRGKYGLTLQRTTAYGVPLLPLIFWYDKPHICAADHYREFVFGRRNPFLVRHEEHQRQRRLHEEATRREADAVHGSCDGAAVVNVDDEDARGAGPRPVEAAAEIRAWKHYERGKSQGGGAPHGIVRCGNFIEETFGRAQRAEIIEHGLAAHAKYGTWQLDVGEGPGEDGIAQIHVVHVHGRKFLTPEQRAACGWPDPRGGGIKRDFP